jgi:hypothetical protein
MAITLTVGKFRSSLFAVTNADGSTNLDATLSVSPGNPATLRVRVNPSNNREVGVMALDVSAGVNANVSVALPGGTKTVQTLFENSGAPANQESLTAGAWSEESAPPAWML